jgi:hypothetical protein
MKSGNCGMAGEYAVASELCKLDFYAQVTLGNLKRTDILVFNVEENRAIRVEVKSKQGKEWPMVKGINDERSLLVLVDFSNKGLTERPDFYILDSKDWQTCLNNWKSQNKRLSVQEGYIPFYAKEKMKGFDIKTIHVGGYKEKWTKVKDMLARVT